MLAGALAATPAAAGVPRPVRPPLPSPLPPIERMADDDPLAGDAAGYWDGQVVRIADLHWRFGLAHELGHVFDERSLDAGERQRFATLQAQTYDEHGRADGTDGSEDLPWLTLAENPDGTVTSSYGDLGEVFADAYANCRLGRVVASGHLWETGYGYDPAPQQHRAICKLIARAAGTPGAPLAADGWR